jgi:hypothetical protein
MKKCTKCSESKKIEEFHKSSKSPDGYKSICKNCVLLKEKERRNTDLYKEKYKLYKNSLSADKKKEYRERYYNKNKESILLKNKEYREENKEKLSEYNKEYREENKERLKKQKEEYRSRPEVKEKSKKWWLDNTDKKKEYRNNYSKDKEREHRKKWYKSFKSRKPYVLAWSLYLIILLKD